MSKLQMRNKIDPICECTVMSTCVHNNGSYGCDCTANEGCVFQFVTFHNDPEIYEREVWFHYWDCTGCGAEYGNVHHYPCEHEHCTRCNEISPLLPCIVTLCLVLFFTFYGKDPIVPSRFRFGMRSVWPKMWQQPSGDLVVKVVKSRNEIRMHW